LARQVRLTCTWPVSGCPFDVALPFRPAADYRRHCPDRRLVEHGDGGRHLIDRRGEAGRGDEDRGCPGIGGGIGRWRLLRLFGESGGGEKERTESQIFEHISPRTRDRIPGTISVPGRARHGPRNLRSTCRHAGSPPSARHTLSARRTTATGRSPGLRVVAYSCRLLRTLRPQWHVAQRLAAHSCRGSRGLEPHSLFIPAAGEPVAVRAIGEPDWSVNLPCLAERAG